MRWTEVYHGLTPRRAYDLSWDLAEVLEDASRPARDNPDELMGMVL